MSPLVSIIIPVYRAVETLPACLAQLKAQTYRPLQLVFIDDCSPDDGLAYLESERSSLEASGIEVTILHHEVNRGVAVARNTGLDAARGEYIYSVDADDLLQPAAIEALVRVAEGRQADVVGCEYMLQEGTSQRPITQPDVKTGGEAFAQICYGRMKWNLWLFLLRRSLIEQAPALRFLPGENMGEDLMLMGKLLQRAGRVAIVHQPFYTYVRSDSQITSTYRPEHWQQVRTNVLELERYLTLQASKESLELLHYLKLNLKLPLLLSHNACDYERWTRMYPESNEYILKNQHLPLRTKLLQWMASQGQFWFVRLYDKVVMQWLYKALYR